MKHADSAEPPVGHHVEPPGGDGRDPHPQSELQQAGGADAIHAAGVSPILRRRYVVTSLLAAAVIAFDRVTKEWAAAALADAPIEIIPGVLSFSFAENFGASFSMLQGAGPFLGVAAVVAAFVIFGIVRSAERPLEIVALGLILGGALGNFVDRVIRGDGFLDGGVIDFIEFPNFPNFNVADSAITIGAVLLIWSAIRRNE